ncbi:connector enhancer of ksr isoform X2 [Oratosquilla oratoria]|uniref:connector enhancer of ksr isoform X2 n=1 Tax=Oratosquilla oratoria TaxID=337810 RepID=UPI003F75DB31
MAYVNVAEWSPDQVSEWLKGLDDAILPYIRFFINNGVDGKRLLQLSPDDLPSLCLTKIGHQEIVLQGVELVRNIHYQLHQENVQYLALRLSSKARSIYNELRISFPPITCGGSAGEEDGEEEEKAVKKQERVPTTTIAGVAEALSSVKGLVSWLNRSPFEGIAQYDELKARLVDLSVRLATISRRDIFAENQGSIIRECCRTLAELSDKIIQDINDPLIIQPASLDVATIKKKADDDWGVLLHSSYHGIHQVSGVRALSPAHQCGKLQLGDELVQVNYQTVVGWTPPKLAALMQENPVEVILTVKKRPRHSNTQHIYFKPFRLPSKKRTYSPWGSSGLSSPRYDLQNLPNLDLNNTFGRISVERKVSTVPQPKSQTPPPALEKPAPPPAVPSLSDTPASDEVDSEFDDDPFLSDDDTAVGASSVRLYHPKPRIPVQRRATIPGATNRPTYSVDELLIGLRGVRYGPNPSCEKRLNASMDSSDDVHIRSGSGSEQRGLRPYTCIGTEKKQNGGPALSEKLAQMKESVAEESEREEGAEKEDKKVVNVIPLPPRQPASHLGPPTIPLSRRPIDSKGLASETTSLNSGYISKGAQPSSPSYVDISPTSKVPDSPLEGRSLWKFSEDRPKLDKSHSTPAYDMEGEETVSQLNISRTSSNASSNLSPSPRAAGKTETRTGCDVGGKVGGGDGISSGSTNISGDGKSGTPSGKPATQTNHNNLATEKEGNASVHIQAVPTKLADCREQHTITLSSVDGSEQCLVGSDSWQLNKSHLTQTSPQESPTSHKCESLPASQTTSSSHASQKSCSLHMPHKPFEAGPGEGSSSGGGKSGLTGMEDENGTSGNNCATSSSSTTNTTTTTSATFSSSTSSPSSSSSSSTSTSQTAGVVLREGRSSSPSVWRCGILVDQGNRRISCRDLGQGDHQGWLYRRRDSKAFLLSHHWERRWFVLKKNILYGYRDKDAIKADSLVYLPGFHVYPAAADVKSKKFAFKIYHSSAGGATFYFACSTSEEMSRWMSQMGLSAISVQTQLQSSTEEDAYFSETDEELDERVSPSKKSPQNTPARVSPSKENEGHFWRAGSASPQSSQNSRGSPLGSLGSSLGALSSGKSQGLKFLQCSRDLQSQPVPTSSFRSYRRVREDGKCNKKSTSTSDLLSTTDSKAQTKGVHRKGSLRERIRNFPASLTMDRKKEIRQTPERSVSVTEMASAVAQRSYRRSTTDLHECGSEGREKEKGNVSATLMEENRSQESLPSPDALKPSLLERRRASEMERNALRSARRGSADGGDMQLSPVDSPLFQSGSSERVPHYMMPTRSSSKQNFSKPEMADLESRGSPTRGGKGTVSPPSSGRCSPFKTDSGRRGSTGDAKHGYERQSSLSSDYWHSSRRGSVDCLASSPPRVTSPPMSPTYSSSLHRRTAQGSSGSLAAGEEYREGSPEKLWINSLRSDSRMKGTKAEKKEKYSRSNADVDRLKKAALYHPPQLKGRGGDPMKAAFELNLDPSFNRDPSLNPDPSITQSTSTLDSPRNSKSGFRLFSSPRLGRRHHSSTSDMSDAENRLTKSPPNAVVSPSSVKTFLGSPKLHKTFFGSNKKKQEEKQLQQQQHLHHLQEQEQLQKQQLQQSTKRETPSSRPEVPPRTKFLSPSERTLPASSSLSSLTSLSSTPQTKARQVPNLTIRAQNEDVPDVPRTPLKPTMGVSMIGKQRRTPGFVSPRDVFFSSPPSSPTVPLSPPLPPLLPPASPAQPPLLPHTHVTTLPPGKAVNGKPKGRLQVLPHYPGMEYPPVFEPGTYSLAPNTESPQQTLTSQGYSIPISTCNTIARSPYGSSPRLGHGGLHNSNSSLGLAGLGSYSSLPQQSASPTSDHTPLRRASPQSERGPARRSPPQSDVTPQGRPSPNSERGPTMRSPLQSDGVLLRKVSPQSEESLIRRSSPQSDGILVRRASPVPSLPTPSRSEVSIPPPRLLLPGPPVVPPSDDEEGWTEEGMLKTSGTQTESQA